MAEHEKLKEICDEIGYVYWNFQSWKFLRFWYNNIQENTRWIIFTSEFMDKLAEYYCNKKKQIYIEWWRPVKIQNIMHHLDKPLDYINKNIIQN